MEFEAKPQLIILFSNACVSHAFVFTEVKIMHPVGIYIHIPFCASKCPYCDFHSGRADEETKNKYTNALIRTITEYKTKDISADTIYFGGGTPPLLGTENLQRVLDALHNSFNISDSAEITVEANPADSLYGFFTAMKSSGVNRISMGLQSGNDDELALLGRRHKASHCAKAADDARRAGIENISLDLMLGIPSQTSQSLTSSINFVSSLSPEHVSAYLLKIEEGTPFYKDTPDIPDDDVSAELYEQCVSELSAKGYDRYEISNFSKQGRESRHNLKYWNAEEYIGIGASAHSFFEGRRFYYPRSTEAFINGIAPVDDGAGGSEEEYAMLRLRLAEGITESGWKSRFGTPIPEEIRKNAQNPQLKNLLISDENGIRLIGDGFLLSNSVICALLT